MWLPRADGTGLSFAAVQGILAGCIVAVVACLAVTALLVYLCARRAARLRGVRPPVISRTCPKSLLLKREQGVVPDGGSTGPSHNQLIVHGLLGKS